MSPEKPRNGHRPAALPPGSSPFCPLSGPGPAQGPSVRAGGTILRRPRPQMPRRCPQTWSSGVQASTKFPLTLPASGPGRTRTPHAVDHGSVSGPGGTPVHGTTVLPPSPGRSAQSGCSEAHRGETAPGKLGVASEPTYGSRTGWRQEPWTWAPPSPLASVSLCESRASG